MGDMISKLSGSRLLGAMKSLIAFLSLLFAVQFFAAPAQAVTYAFRNDDFAYDTPSATAASVVWHASGASPGCTSWPDGDDDWSDITFPAGFTFTFGGVNYTSVRVYSNGMLAFPTDVSGFHRNYTPAALPITTAPVAYTGCPSAVPNNLMIAYWVDIIAGSTAPGAAVKYEKLTDAITGQNRFVITWNNVALYGNTATRYSFQIVLYESLAGVNGNFKFQYTTGSTTGSGATVGVQLSNTDYTQFAFNQNFIDTTFGTSILWYPANQLAAKGAEYRFDEGAWTGAAGEIRDTSGNSQNANRLGAVTNVTAGKLCRGGSFTANTSNATLDAVATPIVPANDGAVSFWYKSNKAWNTADAMLFDATSVATQPFFLMKRSTGALRFVVTDSAGTVRTAETTTAYTFAANTWKHIAVSWSLHPGTNQTVLLIMLDGVQVNTLTLTPFRTTTSGAIAALSTLYLGDNRTSGITPNTGSPNGANGTIDEVYIYPIEINANQAAADMALTRPVCTTLDHFHIVHGGSQVSCGGAVANVTIEAHDVNHGLFTLSGTTMNLSTSTSHGTWSKAAAINPVNNTAPGNIGSATYTFSNEASIVLGLSDSIVETLNINLNSGGITELSGAAASCVASDYTFGTTCDANLDFAQAAFRFVDSAGNPIASQIAGTTSATYYLQAVKNTCTAPGVCTGVCSSVFPSGTSVNIGLASECQNPTTCQAGQQVTFATASPATTGALAANNNGTISATTGTYTTRALTFNAVAPNPTPAVPFTFNYSDVGQINLWARYPTTGTATVTGSSGAFVVKPGGFILSNIKQTAAPNLANPAAAGAAGAKFVKAGEAFTVTVTATTSGGVATPNFGKEATPESVKISSSLLTGLGLTANPAISGSFGTFTNGVATGTVFTWGEVGIINLTPSMGDGDYLGAGDTIGTTTGNVGRFYPDHFDTAVNLAAGVPMPCPSGLLCPAAYNGFVYSGQPFSLTVTAKNASSVATTNYAAANSFAKATALSVFDGKGSATAIPVAVGTLGVPSVSAFVSGTLTDTTEKFIFTSTPTVPTDIYVRAIDTDGASSLQTVPVNSVEGGVKVVNGRLKIDNALGSELLQLPIKLTAQYWDGSGYVLSTTDNATALNVSAVSSASWTNLTISNWQKQPATSAWAAGSTTVVPATASVLLANGVGGFKLTAPGANKTGSVDMILNAPAYMLPSNKARATFGAYRGGKELIYMRENY